jgi:hypothetical protein
MKKDFICFLSFLLFPLASLAVDKSSGQPAVLKREQVIIQPAEVWLDANRMDGVFYNNGIWFYDVDKCDWGLEWPKGTGKSPVFAAGTWVMGKVNGHIAGSGVQHQATEYQPGQILEPFVIDASKQKYYRWYTLHSDGSGDWAQWPFDQGAPYVDENRNGRYDYGELPLLLGDQTVFSVWNDIYTKSEYGADTLSLEVRQTAWAYNSNDYQGDMIFIKWQLVNKGVSQWDSTYFAFWWDPDLGGASDDLVGCDTTLDMGFCYNAFDYDRSYEEAPPAVGVTLLQGPMTEMTGEHVFLPDRSVWPNKKMHGMTAFVFYNSDDSPYGNPHTAQDAYYYMQGRWRDGSPMTYGGWGRDPANPVTTFMYSGDPESGSGWLDVYESDRRFIMSSGPFDMAPWQDENGSGLPEREEAGVQEIIAAVMCARGASNLNSVSKLKNISGIAHQYYTNNFQWYMPPRKPGLNASSMSREVILFWDDNGELKKDYSPYQATNYYLEDHLGERVQQIVGADTLQDFVIDNAIYNFHGYKVYQYTDAKGSNPVCIFTSEIKESMEWIPYGKKDPSEAKPYEGPRHLRILQNSHPAVDAIDAPLINGKTYYFGIVAEAFLEYSIPQIIRSEPAIITVIPEEKAGIRYDSQYGDTLVVEHRITDSSITPSEGTTRVWVADPSKTTGLEYQVGFNADASWYLVNAMSDTFSNNLPYRADKESEYIYDGLSITVLGPPVGVNWNRIGTAYDPGTASVYLRGWDWTGDRWISGYDWGGRGLLGGLDNGTEFMGSTVELYQYVNVELRFAGERKETNEGRWSRGYLYREDLDYAFAGIGDLPFVAIDTDNNRQLNVCFVELDNAHSENWGTNLSIPANGLWDMGWHEWPEDTGYAAEGGHEYIFIMASDYNPDGGVYNDENFGPEADVLYVIWPRSRGSSKPYLHDRFEMQIFSGKINFIYDRFVFTAPDSAIPQIAYLKEDLKKVRVVPNPYYGFHSEEGATRWVQFTHLPSKCSIRIFDLSGVIVQKLKKNDPASSLLQWNLQTMYGKPVGSGIYIYYIEAPGIGEKTGKMAIFQPVR